MSGSPVWHRPTPQREEPPYSQRSAGCRMSAPRLAAAGSRCRGGGRHGQVSPSTGHAPAARRRDDGLPEDLGLGDVVVPLHLVAFLAPLRWEPDRQRQPELYAIRTKATWRATHTHWSTAPKWPTLASHRFRRHLARAAASGETGTGWPDLGWPLLNVWGTVWQQRTSHREGRLHGQ